MEPRRSMTAYASALGGLCAVGATLGYGAFVVAVGVAVVATGLLVHWSYRRLIGGTEPPEHRANLDSLVRRQWAIAGSFGITVGLTALLTQGPLVSGSQAVAAIALGSTVAVLATFASSLVDWYWILPRVGGLGAPGPCETGDGERWKYATAIWLFHRGVATTVVIAAPSVVLFYLAAKTRDTATSAALVAGATLVGGLLATFNRQGIAALTTAFNQPIYVGDTILVNQQGAGEGQPVTRRRAYVVDISVQGIKYQLLRGDRYEGERFQRKGHGPARGEDQLLAIEHVGRDDANKAVPCGAAGCSGVNWYCRNNCKAYD